jgi:hypothetical protein
MFNQVGRVAILAVFVCFSLEAVVVVVEWA